MEKRHGVSDVDFRTVMALLKPITVIGYGHTSGVFCGLSATKNAAARIAESAGSTLAVVYTFFSVIG